MIPSVKNSPYVTELFVQNTESPEARSRQFDQTIKNFRSFCSWGGDTEDYRLLPPYLSNPFIMSFVFRNLEGLQLQVSNQSQGLELIPSRNTVQVSCKELICRKTEKQSFNENFPLSIGSSGLAQDLAKLYCHHFRYQNYSANKAPVEIREWIKKMELEDPILETNNFISLMTGVPDPLLGIKEYQEIPFIAKSSIDKRWNAWSEKVLSTFSNDLLYEESFKVRAVPRRDTAKLRTEGFLLDFTVTLGEMDRLMDDTDKLDLTFNLKLSKNYLRQIRRKWQLLSDEVDTEGQKLFKKEMARYINQNLSYKEKLFTQKMWNEDFSRLIADELLGQVLAYRGPLFDSYKEEMLRVPIRFSYGLFALSYLRYRADTSKGHLKLNL